MCEAGNIPKWDLIVRLVLFCLAGSLHGLGFFLLHRVNLELKNQRLVLMNLAIAEIILCVCVITESICKDFYIISISSHMFIFPLCLSYLIYKSILMYLMIDKTCDIYFHLRYPLIFTQKRTKTIMGSVWLLNITIAGSIALIAKFGAEERVMYNVIVYIYFSSDLIVLATTILSLVYLLYKVRQFTRRDQELSKDQKRVKWQQIWAKYKIPLFILITYLIGQNFVGQNFRRTKFST